MMTQPELWTRRQITANAGWLRRLASSEPERFSALTEWWVGLCGEIEAGELTALLRPRGTRGARLMVESANCPDPSSAVSFLAVLLEVAPAHAESRPLLTVVEKPQ